MKGPSINSYILLLIAFLLYSVSGVFSKLASTEVFLSTGYLKFFLLILVSLGLYAVLWQHILKRFPLSQAFLYKSITVVFSLIYAYIFFNESISFNNMIGASLIVAGIIINSQEKNTI